MTPGVPDNTWTLAAIEPQIKTWPSAAALARMTLWPWVTAQTTQIIMSLVATWPLDALLDTGYSSGSTGIYVAFGGNTGQTSIQTLPVVGSWTFV